jgi:hypothetical protein
LTTDIGSAYGEELLQNSTPNTHVSLADRRGNCQPPEQALAANTAEKIGGALLHIDYVTRRTTPVTIPNTWAVRE